LYGQNSQRGSVRNLVLAAFLTFGWSLTSPDRKMPTSDQPPRRVPLVGRVLAWKESFGFGAGVGPQYEQFVFGVQRGQSERVTPIKVAYAFFKSDGTLPDSFFDYSKWYELKAVRDARCDESVQSLSYVESVEHGSGKPLPPTYVLRLLEGAPKDVLKPEAVLACYVLRPGDYRVLSREKDGSRVDHP
jgi:hypothetical protein